MVSARATGPGEGRNVRAGWLGAAELCPHMFPLEPLLWPADQEIHLLVLSGARRLLNGSQIENT